MIRKSIRRIMIIWIALMAITAVLGKTSIAKNTGRTSADFLNIGVSARGASLGNALTSMADGPEAIYWNPAGMVFNNHAHLSFSHFAWLQDISYDFLGVTYPMSEKIAIGIGAQYLGYGKIDGYDSEDNPTGEIGSTFDCAGSASIAYRVSDNISVGMSGKFVMISLAGTSGSAIAADLGLRYSADRFSIGLAASNLGGKLKFESDQNNLPANIRGGFSLSPFGSALLASFEVQKEIYGNLAIENGLEYNFSNRYFLRTGYNYSPGQLARGFNQGLSFGIGAILGPTQVDYAFTPGTGFSSESIHRFSISLQISK